ncbi:MAG: hypothetical protein GY926_22300 [bacterium]|nr:hypothetical protein [bacterium]
MENDSNLWTQRLLPAAWHKTRELAGTYAILFALGVAAAYAAMGTAAFLLPLTAGLAAWLNILLGLLSTIALVIVLFVVQIIRTHLAMVYEVRKELGNHLNPPDRGPENFSCKIVSESRIGLLVGVNVTNRGISGKFSAQVIDVTGLADASTTPWGIKWRGDEKITTAAIAPGSSQVLDLMSVRSPRRIDFYQPIDAPGGPELRTSAAGAKTARHTGVVRLKIEVLNEVDRITAKKSYFVTLTFKEGRSRRPQVNFAED